MGLTRLARFVYAHAWAVVAAAGVFLVVAGIFGRDVADQLVSVSYEPSKTSESAAASASLSKALGYDSDAAVVVLARANRNVRSADVAAELKRLSRDIAADRRVGYVDSILNGGGSHLISKDGKQTLLVVHTRDGTQKSAIDEARLLRSSLRSDSLDLTLGGFGTSWLEGNETVRSDATRVELIAFPLLFLLLIFVFRSVIAAMLPLAIGVIAAIGASAGLKLLNDVHPTSVLALNMVTVLGVGLAVDYSLLLVSRYREELARHGPGAEAIRATMRSAGRTVAYSSLIVAGSLAALLLFPQQIINSVGAAAMLVSLFAALAALVVVPALLALLGERVNSLSIRGNARQTESRRWYKLSWFVMRHPTRVATPCVLILLTLGIPFLHAHFALPGPPDLPTKTQARQVDDALERDFQPGLDGPINVAVATNGAASTGPELARLQRVTSRLPNIAKVSPPLTLNQGTVLIQLFGEGRPHTAAMLDAVQTLRDTKSPLPILVGGQSADFKDFKSEVGARLPPAVAVMALTTLVLLFLMTGSVLLPVKSLILNLLTICATLGLLVFLFQGARLEGLLDYRSDGGIDLGITIVLSALIFGIVTDYTVFLLARIREERLAGAGNEEAIAQGMQTTGRLLTSAALCFCVAVGSLLATSQLTLKEAGLGLAFAVLLDATVVRAGLVPALMRLMGKWNWWAPAPLRRLHNRIGWTERD